MGSESDDTEPMFTRAQMAKMVNAQVRDKVASALAEYGNLDELREQAAAASKSKTQLDRIEQQLAEATKRADRAEREGLVRRVADKLGISVRQAGRLQGGSYDELLADGREMMEDLGLKPKSNESTTKGSEDADTEQATDEQQSIEQDEQQQDEPVTKPTARRPARPREDLRSGATRTATELEVTDPMKLADLVLKR